MYIFAQAARCLYAMTYEKKQIAKIIKNSILEDVGNGDITTSLLITNKQKATACILVKQECIIAGLEICKLICECVDKTLEVDFKYKDGDFIKADTIIGYISGFVKSILMVERIALNFMQRMSGIATKTNHYVTLIDSKKTKILDTRKTTPNFRIIEKMAVKIGGGYNHRWGLYDEILVKDNHIEANGNLKKTLEKLKVGLSKIKSKYKIIVEVESLSEFKVAVQYPFIDRILLDNMSPNQIKKIVKINNGKKILEASGGINSKTILNFAMTGVDFLSIGELTHNIKSIDISLNIIK